MCLEKVYDCWSPAEDALLKASRSLHGWGGVADMSHQAETQRETIERVDFVTSYGHFRIPSKPYSICCTVREESVHTPFKQVQYWIKTQYLSVIYESKQIIFILQILQDTLTTLAMVYSIFMTFLEVAVQSSRELLDVAAPVYDPPWAWTTQKVTVPIEVNPCVNVRD